VTSFPSNPLVSIITPSLNQVAYIKQTLRSVADQDYANIEHIVVDGGSTDGTLEILRRWNGQWISEPDGGQADAINKGFALANGQIVTWLNSDDFYVATDVISRVVAEFLAGAQVVTGSGYFTDAGGTRTKQWPRANLRRLGYRDLLSRDTVLQPATFFRAELALPLDTSMHWAFDWEMFIRLRQRTSFTVIPIPLAAYRVHPGGKTVTGGAKRKRELLRVMQRYRGRHSPASIALALLVPLYSAADGTPRWVQHQVYRALDLTCRVSQRVSGNRGVPD
jgi:glycosyltransferase involved in cell wall biosynthesis